MPGPQEAVNVLAYPHPAAAVAGVGATRPEFPTAAGGAESETTQALFDECATGWRSAPEVLLPVTLAVRITQDGAFVQRLVFWQDPAAPPAAWAKDFEVLASPDAEGDDFRPVPLDRPAQLLATAEQQWFQVMRLGPPGELGPERLAPEERGRYGQPFPDVLPVKRLVVRVLSTHGAGAGVALGEVGAYGPDLEVTVGPADVMASERTTTAPSAGRFMTCGGAPGLDLMVCPPEIKALTGRPRFVLLLNRSRTEAHTLVTVGQQQDLELRAEPGQAVWGQFVAAAVRGRYDFYCRLPGHDVRGLVGTIVVR
jgi:hypothetical protein